MRKHEEEKEKVETVLVLPVLRHTFPILPGTAQAVAYPSRVKFL